MQVRTKRAVVRMALGRADALTEERGRRRGERLTEALELIERVRRQIGGSDEGQLRAKASELLTDRGIWYGYSCRDYEDPDYEKAAVDLRQALQLNPNSLHAWDNLARALIFHADNLNDAGNRQRRLELIIDGLTVLHEGLQRTAGHRQLYRMLGQALDQLEEITLHDLSVDELARRFDETVSADPGVPKTGAGRAQELFTLATQRLEKGDVSGAISALIAAVRGDPTNETMRRLLIDAVKRKGSQPASREGQRQW